MTLTGFVTFINANDAETVVTSIDPRSLNHIADVTLAGNEFNIPDLNKS